MLGVRIASLIHITTATEEKKRHTDNAPWISHGLPAARLATPFDSMPIMSAAMRTL